MEGRLVMERRNRKQGLSETEQCEGQNKKAPECIGQELKNRELNAARQELEQKDRELEAVQRELEQKNRELEWSSRELEQARQELQRARLEAQGSTWAKSEFLSNMSYDIRTPLNAIINLASLAQDNMDDPLTLENDLEKIGIAGEFLQQLFNDVLDISKIESGKMRMNPQVCTYASFVHYIESVIRPLCEDKNIRFVWDKGTTALDLYLDRNRFQQLFLNILSNAVKYTSVGGTVSFRVANNRVENGLLTCDYIVTDTGCGMSPEFIERAFLPFEREYTDEMYGGTGLGLTISRRITDLLGGKIWIESEKGKGTRVTVRLTLPIATEEQRAAERTEYQAPVSVPVRAPIVEDPRILVVEDHPLNLEIIRRLLENKGYQPECASNGKVALDMLLAQKEDYYQAILMDVRMPVMDGLETARAIRMSKTKGIRDIPIIALTANAFDEDVDVCLKSGMNAYLAKPVEPAKLYEALATYLKK